MAKREFDFHLKTNDKVSIYHQFPRVNFSADYLTNPKVLNCIALIFVKECALNDYLPKIKLLNAAFLIIPHLYYVFCLRFFKIHLQDIPATPPS